MPVSRSPTSSQDRATPMSREPARTLPIASIGAWLCGCAIDTMPDTISTPKAASSSTISPSCPWNRPRATGSARMDRTPPRVNRMPPAANAAAG